MAFNEEIFFYNIGTYLTFGYFSLYFVSVIFYIIKGIKEFKNHIKKYIHDHKNDNDTLKKIQTTHNENKEI